MFDIHPVMGVYVWCRLASQGNEVGLIGNALLLRQVLAEEVTAIFLFYQKS